MRLLGDSECIMQRVSMAGKNVHCTKFAYCHTEVSKHAWKLLHSKLFRFANSSVHCSHCSVLLFLSLWVCFFCVSLFRSVTLHICSYRYFSTFPDHVSQFTTIAYVYGDRFLRVAQCIRNGHRKEIWKNIQRRKNEHTYTVKKNGQANNHRMLSEIENVQNISLRIGFGVYCDCRAIELEHCVV